MAKIENMIKCVSKETGKVKWLPSTLFKDKGTADRLEFVPLEGKKYEDNPDTLSLAEIKAERDAKANRQQKELNEKMKAWEKENETNNEVANNEPAESSDPLGDNRKADLILEEIKNSQDLTFVSKYLNDSRKTVREGALKRVSTLNK